MAIRLLLFAALLLGPDLGPGWALAQSHGPLFLQEPPPQLTFSNTSGSQVSCSAHGSPPPQVDWLLHDGQTVSAVPGLRQSLGNGTLYFPPFRAEDYRKDVHFTVYRCRASNLAGTIISRDVNVRAVVNQRYEVQVYHTHVLAGNTAVMSCVIPAFVREHVSITSWARDDSILLPGSNMGGRMVVTYNTGELHIRSARAEDGLARYSCLTLHTLTQERRRSALAILTVTEPTGSMAPRLLATSQSSISVDRESDVHLTCSAQGNPPPNFNWFREINGHLQSVHSTTRYEPQQDILHIKRLRPEDSGRWTCKVSNQFGEQRFDLYLTVTAHLNVHVLPQLQIINTGENAVFNCTVLGSPMGRVQWLRNGELLPSDTSTLDPRIKLLSNQVLAVSSVTRHDRGMYQCVVRNDRESCQGSAELRLGDTVPELQHTFIEQAIRPGPHVSLRCAATGSPPPQFKWLRDGEMLNEHTVGHRYALGQYVDQSGDVISHLNITRSRTEDGGLYSCRAVNSLGSAEHSARLNIYGSPFIRSIGPVKAVAGSDATLHCPYSGYPIGAVRWERHRHDLTMDLRHRMGEGGALTITRLNPSDDADNYTCFVTKDGKTVNQSIQLMIHSPPIVEPFVFPTSLQEGGRAQIACSVTSGDMPIHFAWFKDDMSISATLQVEERAAEFFSLLIFNKVTSRHSGAYTCVASNSAARANYTAHLMVKVTPQWIIEPQDQSVLLGNPIIVDCAAKGFPNPQITWLKGQGKVVSDYKPLLNLHGRTLLLANGSMWMEAVGPQDEGHYLCRATNGIGSGLGKFIYIGVNEPARFDTHTKNVSTKRGGPVNLICLVYGDAPIEVIWIMNKNRLDLNNYRLSVAETKTDNGVKSQVSISRADREDSGVYKCLAENAYGRSEHVINLAVQERPDPPAALEVVEVSSRNVRLAWRRPFDGNSPVIGYLVQYQPMGIVATDWENNAVQNFTLPVQVHDSNNDRESSVIGGLSPATAYKIRMLAANSIDHSHFTEEVIAKTQEEEPSEAPKEVHVEAVGAGELFISWHVPPRESWNGELLGYTVTWTMQGKPLANNTKTLSVKGWATTKVQLTGLRKFTRYDITVRPYNSVSVGPPSVTVVGTTKEGVPEAAPQHISCSQISSQSTKVSWSPPPVAYHGGLIQGYKVYYRPVATEQNVGVPSTGEVKRTASTETYLHGLYKFTNYSIKLLAFTSAGDGVLSEPIYCTTEEDVPGPPECIKACALTADAILVSWLPPPKPNGRINHYTVYGREAGRVGKHSTYTVRADDDNNNNNVFGIMFEVRNLIEHQLYEFWVSATTSVGEGEPTSIVAQATNSRAQSKIASFSQVLQKAVKSKVVLPCLAVGNPTPRTRWIHRDRPITFSPFYEITAEGFLSIHSADQSLAGNYTCSAKNLFGDDEITYVLFVIMPPGAPTLEIQFTTAKSIRLHWSQPEDGGAMIQGYTLHLKSYTNDWSTIEISSEHTTYTYDDLRCGTVYYVYVLAHNRVGNGSPSSILMANTKGGPPLLPKERDFIATNATALQLSLFKWPDGSCPISHFAVTYRPLDDPNWVLVSSSVSSDRLLVQDLKPATWYQLKVTAQNDAGIVHGVFNFATTTLTGGRIPPPSKVEHDSSSDSVFPFKELYIIGPAITIGVLLVCVGLLGLRLYKNRSTPEPENEEQEEEQEEKTDGRENRRNCQQMYTSSPVKSGMYEISPYATFSVPNNNSRSVITSTLDYTMQFKTFGHIEDEEHNAITYPKSGRSGKHSWHKQRYYNNEVGMGEPSRMRVARGPAHDSESDETSGSPCADFPGGSNYRVPVKSARDMFQPDSSTESNDVSPLAERRHTPRHVVPLRKQHRPTSISSSEEEKMLEDISHENLCLQPPSGFTDNRELSEVECDRDLDISKLPVELVNILSKYQDRKEQDRKEFTIHV